MCDVKEDISICIVIWNWMFGYVESCIGSWYEKRCFSVYVYCVMSCGFMRILTSYVDFHCTLFMCIIVYCNDIPYTIWLRWIVCRCLSNLIKKQKVCHYEWVIRVKLSFIIDAAWSLVMMTWILIFHYKSYLSLRSWSQSCRWYLVIWDI